MGACSGLLYGKVDSEKGAAADTMVDIDWIKGEMTGDRLDIEASEGKGKAPTYVLTDSNGKYVLPFVWHPTGSQIAITHSTSKLKVRTFAHNGTKVDRQIVSAYLCMDFKKLMSGVLPTFESPTSEAVECSVSFLLAYRNIPAFPPHHKAFLTPELMGIVAKANFFLY